MGRKQVTVSFSQVTGKLHRTSRTARCQETRLMGSQEMRLTEARVEALEAVSGAEEAAPT